MPLSGDIHAFEIGAESDRVRKAFDLAATGRRVALICSGDAGIYAMAALAFEMLDETTRSDWRRISIEVAPGISAHRRRCRRNRRASRSRFLHDFALRSTHPGPLSRNGSELRRKAISWWLSTIPSPSVASLNFQPHAIFCSRIARKTRPVVLARNLEASR